MADAPPEPEVLLTILEELALLRRHLSFQDLCRSVSSRFALEHLVELRCLLFAAAARDPCFPATLFRQRVTARGQRPSPIAVAADIVTIFNLIQMTGGGVDVPQPIGTHAPLPVDRSPGPALPGVPLLSVPRRERVHAQSGGVEHPPPERPPPERPPTERPPTERPPLPRRGYSARKRGSLPPEPLSLLSSSPPTRARAVSFDLPHTTVLYPSDATRSLYLPLETDSESSESTDVFQATDVFEPEQEEASVDQKRSIFKKDFHNQPPLIPQVTVQSDSPSPGPKNGFDTRSFEMIPNPYPSPTLPHFARQTEHKSLDDLQDSTYFGPGSESRSPRHLHLPPQKSVWANKSHSLEDQIGTGGASLVPKLMQPQRAEDAAARGREGFRAQATQTDPPDPRRLRSLVHADRLSFMTSLDDPDFCEDDISVIFKFLDDISMCGSTGVLQSDGALNQDSHEARRGRLGKLQRLFHSLESSDDGLKASVCKLLLRMSQIERQLESLAEVKSEISQVLSALQRLDEKIQQPPGGQEGGSRWLEPLSGVSSFMSHPVTPSESSEPQPLSASGHLPGPLPGRLYPATSGSSLDWSRWNGPDPADAALSRTSKLEDKGADVKAPLSLAHSARDWGLSYSRSSDTKVANGKLGKAEQSSSTTNLLSASGLMEQMFGSSLFRGQGALSSAESPDTRSDRARAAWAVDQRQAPTSPLDLQEALDPTQLDFWLDDAPRGGLLGRSLELRKSRKCKVTALLLSAAAVVIVIVVLLVTLS